MLQDDRPKVSIALISGFILILCCAAFTFFLSHEQRVAEGWVRHTSDVEDHLSRAQVYTARAEIQRRGFLLTRDPHALQMLGAMRLAVVPELDRLLIAVADNHPQEGRARALRAAILGKLDEMQGSIDLETGGDHDGAVGIVASAQSRAATAHLLDLIDRMHANEEDLLARRQARADHLQSGGRYALVLCALLIVAFALLVAHDRRRRLLALADANLKLEADIAARKLLERELDQARRRAEALGDAKSSFLAQMSHEIRTPMNGVIGFTKLILDGELNDSQRRHAELIADSGRAMMRLLNDILDLSKIEAGHLRVLSEPFELAHAIRASAKLMAPAVQQKGLRFECIVAPDVPPMMIGDGLRLRQILINLIGNAVKFTSEGSISVRATVEGAMVHVEVADTGIGIVLERQAAIFQRFVQADDGITPKYGGTGLGLAISMQLATLMGGTLTVSSEPGRGSCFLLAVPLRLPEVAPEAAPLAEPGRIALPEHRAVHILVAEDHDVNQMLIRELLERRGHRIDVVDDGEAAVAAVAASVAAHTPYDLVLMDMQMPVMDGIEATRRIRAAGHDPAALPIIALTANAYADDIAACLSAGMQAHLSKPLDDADLDGAIRRWARRGDAEAKPTGAARFSARLQERYGERRTELIDLITTLSLAERVTDDEVTSLAHQLHKFLGSAEMFGDAGLAAEARSLEVALATGARADRTEALRRTADIMAQSA